MGGALHEVFDICLWLRWVQGVGMRGGVSGGTLHEVIDICLWLRWVQWLGCEVWVGVALNEVFDFTCGSNEYTRLGCEGIGVEGALHEVFDIYLWLRWVQGLKWEGLGELSTRCVIFVCGSGEYIGLGYEMGRGAGALQKVFDVFLFLG